jgi:peptidoglycan/xylan/chitin deacetylase (PgdA/CDA1 family)
MNMQPSHLHSSVGLLMSTTLPHFMVDSALQIASAMGLAHLMPPSHAGIGAILSFHRVHRVGRDEFGSRAMSVAPETFRGILDTLIARGYDFVSMSGLLDRLAGGLAANSRVVCLTFDDGFVDTYTSAFPICRACHVPMTVYLVSGFMKREFPMWGIGLEAAVAASDELVVPVEGELLRLDCRTYRAKRKAFNTVAARLACAHPDAIRRTCDWIADFCGIDVVAASDRAALTPAMIHEMRDSGLVEFGAHSASHPRLSGLDNAEALSEIERSKRDCETLVGRAIRHFAYPFGDAAAAGDREAAICAELGFASAVTTEGRPLFPADSARPFALPRLTFNGSLRPDLQLDLLLSGALPAARRQWQRLRGRRPPASRALGAPA